MNINFVLNAVPPTKTKANCVPAATRTIWEIGGWGNKGNILDKAEKMGGKRGKRWSFHIRLKLGRAN